jgi:aspartyl-tRNA(Asn)/glutamyl-tRNA(Gln) amidotransferase subunit B
VKNLNSFSVLERATGYEIARQLHAWEQNGDLGRKPTRGWDESTGTTFLQREKEEAHDYRYFPDPDLVPVVVDDAWLAEIKQQLPELPAARRARYEQALGLSASDAGVLSSDRATGDFFEATLALGAGAKRSANLLINVVQAIAARRAKPLGDAGVSAAQVAEVARLIDDAKIAASSALPLFERAAPGESMEQLAEASGLIQSADSGAIDAAIDALLQQNPKSLTDYRAGKQAALGSLVGMIMKGTKGLNPKLVQERLRERLG